MAYETVKASVLKDFGIWGTSYVAGEDIDIPVHLADKYVRNGYIEVSKTAEKKIAAVEEENSEKQVMPQAPEKNSKAGPKGKK